MPRKPRMTSATGLEFREDPYVKRARKKLRTGPPVTGKGKTAMEIIRDQIKR